MSKRPDNIPNHLREDEDDEDDENQETTVDNDAITAAVEGSSFLADIEYKDQGLTAEELKHRRRADSMIENNSGASSSFLANVDYNIHDEEEEEEEKEEEKQEEEEEASFLSNLEYKWQGLTLEEIMQRKRDGDETASMMRPTSVPSPSHVLQVAVPVARPIPSSISQPSETIVFADAVPVPDEGENEGENNDPPPGEDPSEEHDLNWKHRTIAWGKQNPGMAACVVGGSIVLLGVIVLVAVMVSDDDSGSGDGSVVDWNGLSSSPTFSPTSAPIPNTSPKEAFETPTQLRQAIVDYIQDNSPNTEVAQRYGYPIGNWNVSLITNMECMFASTDVCVDFTCSCQGLWDNATTGAFNEDISGWDVAQVTSMRYMFYNATSFNQPLASWNLEQVIDLGDMFYHAYAFNQPLNSWSVDQVTYIQGMFNGATAFNQNLNFWNVGQVTNMRWFFYEAAAFNQPLDSWDVSKVNYMESMFAGAYAFNQPLGSWNVSRVLDMHHMFLDAVAFNQPLDSWDVSGVTNMVSMFRSANSFNQNLCTWAPKLPAVTLGSLGRMFESANACPLTQDPILDASPPGPFCWPCTLST